MTTATDGYDGVPPLRVCLVAPVPPPYGGIGHWTLLMLHHVAGRRDVALEVVNIAPRWRSIHQLAAWRRVVGGGIQLLRDVARLAWILLRRRPDVVHLTTSGQLALVRDLGVALVCRLAGTPVAYHIRFGRVPEIAAAGTSEWRLMRAVIRRVDTVIAIDVATEQALRAHAADASVVRIPNCVSVQPIPERVPQPRAESTRAVMYLGWVVSTKGVGELLTAWVSARRPGWRLRIVGPVDTEYLAALRRDLDLADVEFTGELDHDAAMNALATSDLFVLPSYTEGFPNVVLEAMALGKPIIATAVGAIPEMLEHGCGVLVPPRDVAALEAALRSQMDDPGSREEMGIRARERAIAEYSIDAVFARYTHLWTERRGPGRR